MKLKKLLAVEIASAVIVLVVILIFVEVTPYLARFKTNPNWSLQPKRICARDSDNELLVKLQVHNSIIQHMTLQFWLLI